MKKIIFLVFVFLMVLTGCAKNDNSVVIYSSMEEDRNQALIEHLKEKFPSVDVRVQSIATGNSAAKVKNEGTNVEADIILDLETAHMKSLEDNFANLSDFSSDVYLDGINKSENYFTWIKYTMNLIVDVDYFEEHGLKYPKTYNDLLKKEYKNLIAMPDPKTSGTGYAFYLNVVNLMGEKKAIEYFKALKENLREFTTSGSGPSNLLKQGEIAIAMGMTAQGVAAINEGYNFKVIELETGSAYNTTSLGIIKGREEKENVVQVFKWLVNEYNYHDKKYFMPDKILKNQEIGVKNYPTDLKDADMEGIDSTETKEHLMELWGEVNG